MAIKESQLSKTQLHKLDSDTGRVVSIRLAKELNTRTDPLAQKLRERKIPVPNSAEFRELKEYLENLESGIRVEVRAELLEDYSINQE